MSDRQMWAAPSIDLVPDCDTYSLSGQRGSQVSQASYYLCTCQYTCSELHMVQGLKSTTILETTPGRFRCYSTGLLRSLGQALAAIAATALLNNFCSYILHGPMGLIAAQTHSILLCLCCTQHTVVARGHISPESRCKAEQGDLRSASTIKPQAPQRVGSGARWQGHGALQGCKPGPAPALAATTVTSHLHRAAQTGESPACASHRLHAAAEALTVIFTQQCLS